MTDINLLRQYKSDPQLVMGSKHQINKFKKCTFINHVWKRCFKRGEHSSPLV